MQIHTYTTKISSHLPHTHIHTRPNTDIMTWEIRRIRSSGASRTWLNITINLTVTVSSDQVPPEFRCLLPSEIHGNQSGFTV